ncbi:MAG: 7-cyano-7-deazaguanine synthase [Planctomycetaceae bacterium]
MERIAVLASGGLDSCVLIADLARSAEVTPIHVSMGLVWEAAEVAALERFLAAVACPSIQPLVKLTMPVQSLYGSHWSVTGQGVPPLGTPDEDVYLPGRNVLLFSLVGIWCSLHNTSTMAIGSLSCNPFPDGTPEFFQNFPEAVGQGLNHPLKVIAPYRGKEKIELIRNFADLPLELSLTCLTPVNGGHCGQCSKCGERRQAFVDADVKDPTVYAASPHL